MDLKNVFKIIGKHLYDNRVNYLTAASIAFEVGALALTFKHAPKCKEIMDRYKDHEAIRGEKLPTREKAEPLIKELWAPAMCAAVSIGCAIGACKTANKTSKALKTLEKAYAGVTAMNLIQKKELEKLPEKEREEAEKKADRAMAKATAAQGDIMVIDTGTGDEVIQCGVTGQMYKGSRGAFSIIFMNQRDRLVPDTEGGEGEDYVLYSEFLQALGGKSDITAGQMLMFTASNRRNMAIRFVQMDGGDKPWWIMKVSGLVLDDQVYLD